MVKNGGFAMKHGNSPMNKCITVEYVCVCIYIYVRCTDILFGNTTRGVHEGWARKFHIYHRKNKTNIILLKFHRKTDGLSQQGRFGKLMVYPNKREGWRSKSLGFTKGFHLQLIP